METVAQPEREQVVEVTLTASDRCDGCGAQAYVRVTRLTLVGEEPREEELLFCGHHYHRHAPKLEGWDVEDFRYMLS